MPKFCDIPNHVLRKYLVDILTEIEVDKREDLFYDGQLLWKDVIYDKGNAREIYFKDMPNAVPKENVLDIININWNLHYHKSHSYAKKSYLIGPMTTINAGRESGHWKEFWVKTINGYKMIKCSPKEIQQDNNFIFEYQRNTLYDVYEFTVNVEPHIPEAFHPYIKRIRLSKGKKLLIKGSRIERNVEDIEVGDEIISNFGVETILTKEFFNEISDLEVDYEQSNEVFIRKDSYFYYWLSKYYPEYTDQVAINKLFLYFGPIFDNRIFNYSGPNKIIDIIFYGMKDYVIHALPEINRTERFQEFLQLYFDKIYQKFYKNEKEIASLMDPYEIESHMLPELAETFGVDIRKIRYNDFRIRQYVNNYIYFLKRKGTYTSLIIIWHLLHTRNKLHIYDNFHNAYVKENNKLTDEFIALPYLQEELHITSDFQRNIVTYNFFEEEDKPFVFKKDIKENVWRINHVFNTKVLQIYIYDDNFNLIKPSRVIMIDNFNIDVYFRKTCNGWVFLVKPLNQFRNTDEDATNEWNVQHDYDRDVLVSVQDGNQNLYKVDNINIQNNLILLKNNTSFRRHYVTTTKRNFLYIHNDNSNEWIINHYLGFKGVVCQCYDLDWNVIYPKNIRLINDNRCIITFEEGYSGYVNIKAITNFEEHVGEGERFSTHYKLEMNLNNEPLDDNKILSQDTMEGLYEAWEMIRPAVRTSHYRILLNPNVSIMPNEYVLYNDWYNTNFYSNCLVEQIAELDTYTHRQKFNSDIWEIQHTLNTKSINFEFYNNDFIKIKPIKIEVLDYENIKVYFNQRVRGYALMTKTNINEPTEIPREEWNIRTPFGTDVLINFTDIDYNHYFFPAKNIIINGDDIYSTFEYPLDGYFNISRADYVHKQEIGDEKKVWICNHNLLKGVITQCYNWNNEMIYPENVELYDDNTCLIEFDEPISGYANIKSINSLIFRDEIMENLIDGTFRIGNAGGSAHHSKMNVNLYTNDVEHEIYRGNFTYIHDTNDAIYLQIDIPIDVKRNDLEKDEYKMHITELGIFDRTGLLVFYSYFGEVYKMKDTNIRFLYKIDKV